MAKLPVDPRLARMLMAGEETGSLAEVAIIAAGLSIQDPQERPGIGNRRRIRRTRRFPIPAPTSMAF